MRYRGPAVQGQVMAAHERELVAQERGLVRPQRPAARWRGLAALPEPAAPS